jgi:hypothetical protein
MCCANMKDTKLHIVGLEALDEQVGVVGAHGHH